MKKVLVPNLFKQKPTFILFLSCFFAFSELKAQEKPSSGVWTLQQCIDYGVKNNITVLQNEQRVNIAGNNLQQSKVNRLPSVNANASQNLNWGRSVDPFTNQFVNQQVNSNNFSITGSVPIFNGWQQQNTIRRNRTDLEVSQLNAQQTKNDISLDVATAYLNILLNKELLSVAEQNVNSTKIQLERTTKLFEAGSVAENEVINLKAQLANNELAVVNAQNQIGISKLNLQQTMNLPADESFDIERVNADALQVSDFAETAAQVYTTAEATQYNIKSAEKSIISNEYAIDVAKASRYPSLSLDGTLFTGYSSATARSSSATVLESITVGYVGGDLNQPVTNIVPVTVRSSGDYPFLDQLSDNFRQQISLRLSIPIFNGWQVKNNVSNAVINKRIAELTAQNTKVQLRQTIELAYNDARSALNTYNARRQQVESLQLAFETTEKRFNAGAANSVDYNIAKVNLDNAKSDFVRAKYDYLFRRKVLDFYQNKPLDIK